MPNPLRDAIEEAKRDLTVAGRESAETLEDAAESAVNETLADALGDPEDIPEVIALGENFNFRTAATQLMDSTTAIYASQAAETVRALKTVSEEAMKEGTKILVKMTEIGQLVVDRQISPESAQRALEHYAEALKLIGRRLENKAKAEAYKRAQAALATAKSVLFTGLQVALQVGKQAASAYIGRLPTPPTA